MAKQSDWTKVVTPSIKNNMKESAHTAYLNGCDLREDALSLFSIKRYARSAALAILSDEEFSKAFILLICAGQGRWDSNIYKALRKHSKKQGISEGMRDHFDWFSETYRQFMAEHGSSFTQHQPPIIPCEKRVSELREKVRSRFSKPVRDFLKQDAFYVSLDEDGKVNPRRRQSASAMPKSVLMNPKSSRSSLRFCLATQQTWQSGHRSNPRPEVDSQAF